jgi:hypothetical protein
MSGLRFRRKKLFKITRRTVRPIFLCCLTLYSALCGPRVAFEGGRPTSTEHAPLCPEVLRSRELTGPSLLMMSLETITPLSDDPTSGCLPWRQLE